jgi:hypothetical protein
LATREDPASAGCPAGGWSLQELALTLLKEVNQQDRLRQHLQELGQTLAQGQLPELPLLPMSRSTLWRILEEADLKPHRSVYWLDSHAPDFQVRAEEICQLYLAAPTLWQQHREVVLSTDEKTGILIRRRKHPTKACKPGQPRRREHEYVRLGSRHLSATFCVPTGQLAYDLTQSHNGSDFVAHLLHAVEEMPKAERYHWVLDNNRTHSTPGVCACVAALSGIAFDAAKFKTAKDRRAWLCDPEHKHVFHFTPVHGSWLNQVELFFSVFSRSLLRRDDFASVEAFLRRVEEWMDDYNSHKAHPYRWTYTGTPLVRDTPTEQTAKQKRRGRAPFGPRPKFFQRLFYPPRPYHKATSS